MLRGTHTERQRQDPLKSIVTLEIENHTPPLPFPSVREALPCIPMVPDAASAVDARCGYALKYLTGRACFSTMHWSIGASTLFVQFFLKFSCSVQENVS